MERFLVYAMAYSYAEGGDVHGFPQEAHLRYVCKCQKRPIYMAKEAY